MTDRWPSRCVRLKRRTAKVDFLRQIAYTNFSVLLLQIFSWCYFTENMIIDCPETFAQRLYNNNAWKLNQVERKRDNMYVLFEHNSKSVIAGKWATLAYYLSTYCFHRWFCINPFFILFNRSSTVLNTRVMCCSTIM